MLFTIIIPVYNRADKVKSTLASVLAQTYRPLQVVLVDNDSTDDSLQVLKAFQAQHSADGFEVVVAQESHHTASATRNRGFAEAKGDWVLFFDSDDTMRPTLVESYRNAITQHGGALDLVATKACLHSLDGSLRNLPFFTTDLFANQILHSIFSTQRYAVRREYFAKFGGWNNDVLQWDDWELGIRLMLGQPRVATISDALVDIYESGEASITGANFSDRIGRWEQALDETTHQVANSNHPEKKRMLHLIDFRRIVLAAHYAKEGKTEAARELYAPAYRRLAAGSPLRRIILPLLYHFTSKGLRGASRLAKCLIRN
ncbi:MAG: glycosyltransferase family 2 protein [Bacteroidales bacterium]|nr:glycosyltransferase family 2 protein [Bacteroidales bacterium]